MAKTFGELTLVRKTTTEKDFTCVKYIEDGTKVVAGNSDGLVRVYESGTLELLQTLGTPKESEAEPANPVTDISNIPPRNPKFSKFFIATYTNGYVKLWNTDKGKAVTTLDEQRQTLSVAFSPNQPNFVTVGDDAIIYLYDEQTMSVIQTLRSSESGKIDGHSARVFTAEFHPKYTYDLLTGGWDNTVQFWDVRKPTSVRYISGPHICGNGIVFKPGSGKEIITASYQKENALQKWDYSTGKLLVNFEPDIYKCMFYCAKWVEQDFLLTGGSDPSIFKLMHLPSNNTIGYVRSQQTGVYSIDYKILRAATPKLEKEESITAKSSSKTITNRERSSSKIDDFTIIRSLICTGRYLFEIDANLDAK